MRAGRRGSGEKRGKDRMGSRFWFSMSLNANMRRVSGDPRFAGMRRGALVRYSFRGNANFKRPYL